MVVNGTHKKSAIIYQCWVPVPVPVVYEMDKIVVCGGFFILSHTKQKKLSGTFVYAISRSFSNCFQAHSPSEVGGWQQTFTFPDIIISGRVLHSASEQNSNPSPLLKIYISVYQFIIITILLMWTPQYEIVCQRSSHKQIVKTLLIVYVYCFRRIRGFGLIWLSLKVQNL